MNESSEEIEGGTTSSIRRYPFSASLDSRVVWTLKPPFLPHRSLLVSIKHLCFLLYCTRTCTHTTMYTIHTTSATIKSYSCSLVPTAAFPCLSSFYFPHPQLFTNVRFNKTCENRSQIEDTKWFLRGDKGCDYARRGAVMWEPSGCRKQIIESQLKPIMKVTKC